MKYLIILILFFCFGCAVINTVSMSNMDLSKFSDKRVSTEQNVIGVLHLPFLTPKHEFYLTWQLKEMCPMGQVSNVQTVLTTTDYLIIQDYNVTVSANCSKY